MKEKMIEIIKQEDKKNKSLTTRVDRFYITKMKGIDYSKVKEYLQRLEIKKLKQI